MNTERELELLDHHGMGIANTTQPVFLMELSQMDTSSKSNAKGLETLRKDLTAFLGVHYLPKMGKYHPPYERVDSEIDICDDRYEGIRHVLLQHGIKASTWIQEYLLYSPQVVVSSRDHFIELLEAWKEDPCAAAEDDR